MNHTGNSNMKYSGMVLFFDNFYRFAYKNERFMYKMTKKICVNYFFIGTFVV